MRSPKCNTCTTFKEEYQCSACDEFYKFPCDYCRIAKDCSFAYTKFTKLGDCLSNISAPKEA